MSTMSDDIERRSGLRVFGRSKSGKRILQMEQRDGFLWCRDEDGWQPAIQDLTAGDGVALNSMADPNFDDNDNCINSLMEQFLNTRVRPN